MEERTLQGRQACELEKPDVDKIELKAWLKFGKLFSEIIGFMVAIDDQVVSSRDYEVYILKDPNVTIDTRKQFERNHRPFNIQLTHAVH